MVADKSSRLCSAIRFASLLLRSVCGQRQVFVCLQPLSGIFQVIWTARALHALRATSIMKDIVLRSQPHRCSSCSQVRVMLMFTNPVVDA